MNTLKNNIILLLVSHICKKIFALIFFIYGCFMALCRWELRKYLKEVAIINDVYLNVVGKYALNQYLRKDGHEFGSRLETVSCALGRTNPEPRGKWWMKQINKIDKDHFNLSIQNQKQAILKEYKDLNQ